MRNLPRTCNKAQLSAAVWYLASPEVRLSMVTWLNPALYKEGHSIHTSVVGYSLTHSLSAHQREGLQQYLLFQFECCRKLAVSSNYLLSFYISIFLYSVKICDLTKPLEHSNLLSIPTLALRKPEDAPSMHISPEEKMHRYLCLKKRSYPQLERPKHRRDNRVSKSPFNQS